MTHNASSTLPGDSELQLASFQLGDLLLGIDIHQVQEINRNFQLTPVPHAPEAVRGVINLRGEVVTVIDLRSVLGFPAAEINRMSRNVVVHHAGEQIGLLVDCIADVVKTSHDQIDPLPENLDNLDSGLFQGVVKLEHALLVVLDVASTLAAVAATAEG